MSNLGGAYWGVLLALEEIQEVKEREKQDLLNTIASAEAELAKVKYFGFLIKRDKMGYLEALSKTKTIFRGINPHDPLDGMVIKKRINPDFVVMLEKNYFEQNSEKIDIDEFHFMRYQAQRDSKIDWVKKCFKDFLIDDKYLIEKINISQKELIQRLQSNEWIWSIDIYNKRLRVLDVGQYIQGLESEQWSETLPRKYCIHNEVKKCNIDLSTLLEEKRLEKERQDKELEEMQRLKNKTRFRLILRFLMIIALVVIIINYKFFGKQVEKCLENLAWFFMSLIF